MQIDPPALTVCARLRPVSINKFDGRQPVDTPQFSSSLYRHFLSSTTMFLNTQTGNDEKVFVIITSSDMSAVRITSVEIQMVILK